MVARNEKKKNLHLEKIEIHKTNHKTFFIYDVKSIKQIIQHLEKITSFSYLYLHSIFFFNTFTKTSSLKQLS